jgi:hypothetical protein
MRNNVLAALAVACALASCGDDDSGQRPDTGISAHDEAVMLRIDTQVRKWNRAAAPWVKAFGGDDANRFLVVHERSLKPLNSVAARVEVGSRQIADRALRVLVIPIGDQYRRQFNGWWISEPQRGQETRKRSTRHSRGFDVPIAEKASSRLSWSTGSRSSAGTSRAAPVPSQALDLVSLPVRRTVLHRDRTRQPPAITRGASPSSACR